jgi:ribosome biogenesis GTPase
MKKKSLDKKKRKTVRERDWEKHGDTAFSHDLVKHRRATVKLSDTVREQQDLPRDFEPNALVIAHSKKWGFVQYQGSERLCRMDERLHGEGATLIAPGDLVLVEEEASDGECYIRGVVPRRSRLSRPAARHGEAMEQVIAANVDHLIVVAAASEPPFKPGLVDRYLIAAQTGGIQPILCINKMDLVEAPPEELELYRGLDVQIHLVSCKTGQGLAELYDAIRGKTSVLSGHSGVGKSSMVSALDPNLRLHTQTLTKYGRGQHTTTGSRLYELEGDTYVIDTPGVRALGLWGVSPRELEHYFPDISRAAEQCRFRNCTHTHEPECAVRDAAATGEINPARFASYLRIRSSLETGITPGRTAASWQSHRKDD